ncbi:MAG: hypothetical protein IAE79_10855 [Anaerolinea sp.]|nr:hypothetical protein [Anaerolinea sp.]
MSMITEPTARTFFGLRRSEVILLALLIFLLTLLIVFLNFPTNAHTPAWLPVLQNQLRQLFGVLIPYGVVGVLGAIVAVAELASTFQTYPREALQTRWARILIGINIVAAVLALAITRLTMPQMNQVLQVLGVGVGFQALIRTRFVLAKPIGGNGSGEVSLNLGWLYDQFQHLCRTQIDLELMNNRRTAVIHLLTYYPSLAELYDIAWYTIIARATLTAAEEAAKLAELEKLLDPKAPEQFARSSLALMILENGGPGYVNLLLDQAMTGQPAETPTRLMSAENLVWQLVERFSLDGLVTFTEQLTPAAEVRNWVREAAKPNSETNETNQKAAVAHFLVQQVGAEVIQRALAGDGE